MGKIELDSAQIVTVVTSDWDATSGELNAYERRGDRWVKAVGPVAITVGRNGLSWGRGLHDNSFNEAPIKREGDGKSPAGIFTLDSLYGYGPLDTKMEYLVVDSETFCVDDPKSRYYNQIVHGSQVEKDWDSAETMLMQSDAYKYGIVVGYNRTPAVAGAGSCIFFHLGEPDGTTAGCTAMAEDDILRLIEFLDPGKRPLLVQVPVDQYKKLAERYIIPSAI